MNQNKLSFESENLSIHYICFNIQGFIKLEDIGKDDQFKPEFKKISPFSKIPVIKDVKNNQTIFESGAILIYLGEQSGKFYNEKDKTKMVRKYI